MFVFLFSPPSAPPPGVYLTVSGLQEDVGVQGGVLHHHEEARGQMHRVQEKGNHQKSHLYFKNRLSFTFLTDCCVHGVK